MTIEEQIQKLYALIKDYRHETEILKSIKLQICRDKELDKIKELGFLNWLNGIEAEKLKSLVFFDVTDFKIDDIRKYKEYKDLKNTCEFFYSIEYIVFKSSLKRNESN